MALRAACQSGSLGQTWQRGSCTRPPKVSTATRQSALQVQPRNAGVPELRLPTMPERNTIQTTTILWLLAAAYAAALVGNIAFGLSIPIAVVLSISVAFALIHGAVRYGWRGIATFIVICLAVSNIMENASILTGFPFGHYHYTDVLGLKLFLVPVLIGPAYFATGYLAWVLGNVITGEVRRESDAFTTFAAPFIASFLMVMWDLTF